MINEQIREMVSLIACGQQQWCDCLRRYSISTMPAPFHPFLPPPPSSPFCRPRCNPVRPGVLFPRFLTAYSSPVRRVRSRARIGAIMIVSVWEGGRQTFKSTPPQSNYRPGHEMRCPCIIYVSCRVPQHRRDISVRRAHTTTVGGRGPDATEEEPREIVARAYRC